MSIMDALPSLPIGLFVPGESWAIWACFCASVALRAYVHTDYLLSICVRTDTPLGGLMHRRPVNKRKSSRSFRKAVGKTQPKNLARPGRGGFRL